MQENKVWPRQEAQNSCVDIKLANSINWGYFRSLDRTKPMPASRKRVSSTSIMHMDSIVSQQAEIEMPTVNPQLLSKPIVFNLLVCKLEHRT